MKLLRFFLIIFISLTSPVKADLNKKLINQLEEGGKLIFIRHAYAPGSGDPDNFNLNDCSTQRNLSKEGQRQAEYIGEFFRNNKVKIDKVLSSEWCRCKETAKIAFKNFSTKSFLNSFEGLNKTTFLADIIFSSFVFGFLPILNFFCLIENVPKLEIFTFFSFLRFDTIIEKNSSIRFSEMLFENPICI